MKNDLKKDSTNYVISPKLDYNKKFFIFTNGGKQYKVVEGSKIRLDYQEKWEIGQEVSFPIMFSDVVTTGKTVLTGKVLNHGKGDKLKIFRAKTPRTNNGVMMGFRPKFTLVQFSIKG